MITDAILIIFLSLADFIVSLVPSFNLRIPNGVLNITGDVFSHIGYFLPVSALLTLLAISVGISHIQFFASLIWRIKSFIPGMGD